MQDATHPSLHAAGAGSERLKETRPNLSCSPDEVVAVELVVVVVLLACVAAWLATYAA